MNGKLSANFTNPAENEVTNLTVKADVATESNSINFTDKGKNILIVIDGVKQPQDYDWSGIDPNTITAITVYKNQEALDRYGEKDRDGVIEITTKKEATVVVAKSNTTQEPITMQSSSIILQKDPDGSSKIRSWEIQGTIEVSDPGSSNELNFKLVNDGNTGFIIKKDAKTADLDFYVKKLADVGITMKYSGIKRNANGEITKIKIDLAKGGNKASGKIESSEGIANIYVGEKEGVLVASPIK